MKQAYEGKVVIVKTLKNVVFFLSVECNAEQSHHSQVA